MEKEVFSDNNGNHFNTANALANTDLTGTEFGTGHTHDERNAGDSPVDSPSQPKKGGPGDYQGFLPRNNSTTMGPHLATIASSKGITIYSTASRPIKGSDKDNKFPTTPSIKIDYNGKRRN